MLSAREAMIQFTDDMGLKKSIHLAKVLTVPSLDRRLFSVTEFASYYGNKMTFSPHGVLFQFPSGSTLTLPPQKLTSTACLSTTGNTKRILRTNINILHHWLGHWSIHGLLSAIDHNVWADSVAQQDLIGKCVTCPLASHKMAMRSKQQVTPPDCPVHTIFVDTIQNPRPKGITAESRCSHFLLVVDHQSRFAFM